MKKYYVNYKEVNGTRLSIEMNKALKKEFPELNYRATKDLMVSNLESLEEVGRNNIHGVEFEIKVMTVKCCNCNFIGEEEDLKVFEETVEEESYKACPNCHTDEYLSDVESAPKKKIHCTYCSNEITELTNAVLTDENMYPYDSLKCMMNNNQMNYTTYDELLKNIEEDDYE